MVDSELKCNRLTCRKPLTDKAVVTTCSHIFCVECANELFNAARLCPACETSLSERDDVVVCSLNPTNDYKTSVLSGLSPSTILDICNRAISFWQYQIHQENSFQHAIVRNLSDTNTQVQKQLENVVREANSEINILNNKLAELERDLELERKKVRELQDASRNQDKEYQKLKNHYDKVKRKALLPHQVGSEKMHSGPFSSMKDRTPPDNHLRNTQKSGTNPGNALGDVFGSMELNGIQRTPLINRNTFMPQSNVVWQPTPNRQGHTHGGNQKPRQPFGLPHRTGSTSSASEVENLLNPHLIPQRAVNQSGWFPPIPRSNQRIFAPSLSKRTTSGFRPAG